VITGPLIKVRNDAFDLHQNGRSERKVWYRQGKPYKRPLAFTHTFNAYRWTSPTVDPMLIPFVCFNAYNIGVNLVENGQESSYGLLYARAYDKFMKKVGDKCGWLINLMEGHKSLEMIATRCKQLGSAWKHLRSFNIPALARDLALHPADPRLKKLRRNGVVNNLSNSWLELSFGWTPLITDIHDSIEILQRDFPSAPIRAGAIGRNLTLPVYRGSAAQIEHVGVAGTLKITNPQLFLANQLGLINPVAVAWDAVPFSFVVDWFVPVGKFLNSLTNEVGCEIVSPRITVKRSVIGQTYDGADIVTDIGHIYLEDISSFEGRFFERKVPDSLPIPSLYSRLRRPQFDAWKAVTSLALFTQQMKLR